MAFAKPSEYESSGFFKPAEYSTAVALLIEPKSIEHGVPNTYKNKTTMRDEVTATVTVFATSESLEKGRPSRILRNVKVVHTILTSTLEGVMNAGLPALCGVLRKRQTSNGEGWYFADCSPEVEALASRYYESREAEIGAAAANAPSFDDDEPPF